MNSKETLHDEVMKLNYKRLIVELPTGTGKTRIGSDYVSKDYHGGRVLIVLPKHSVTPTWVNEFKIIHPIWEDKVEFVMYASLHKKVQQHYEWVILDEVHHTFSDKRKDALLHISHEKMVCLSATLKSKDIEWFKTKFDGVGIYYQSMKKTMEDNIIPTPKILVMPMELDNVDDTFDTFDRNPKGTTIVHLPFKDRFKYWHSKDIHSIVHCTQWQMYLQQWNLVEYYRKKWLQTGDKRYKQNELVTRSKVIKWLSRQKTDTVRKILGVLGRNRSLTFCADIEHAQVIGNHDITSKTKHAMQVLQDYNDGKIHDIQAVNMLDEGVNLVNTRIGIYGVLSGNDRLIIQRTGRILRHKEPVIIIPYFKHTRDEEIVVSMIGQYDRSKLKIIHSINEIPASL